MTKTGSETIGAAGEKSKMTLFKDDRAEDIGAIIVSILVIATVIVLTMNKPVAQAPEHATTSSTAGIPAPVMMPAVPADSAKK